MTLVDRLKVFATVTAIASIAIVFIGAFAEKADCEAKGGKRLRGTWAWEGFECYQADSLKVLP